MVNKTLFRWFVASVMFLGILAGCDHRFDVNSLPKTKYINSGDTTYIEINPPWFNVPSPRSITVGNDNLLYVADYDNNQIYMLDASGAIQKQRFILHPTAIAQSAILDLYVTGQTISSNGDTVAALFRIALARFDTTYLASIDTTHTGSGETVITKHYRDTSYFYDHNLNTAPLHQVWSEAGHPLRRFVGVAILSDNRYLVARTGSDNASAVDPDTRLLLFNKGDTLITSIADVITRAGSASAVTDIVNLTNVFTFPAKDDFILTQDGATATYGVVYMTYSVTAALTNWVPKYDPSLEAQRGIDFIRPYRYSYPVAAAYDKRRQEIFICDAEQDSIVKFNSRGAFKTESFGKALTLRQSGIALNHPTGIAFSGDCVLYVADNGNRIIRRFRLSNQTSCF